MKESFILLIIVLFFVITGIVKLLYKKKNNHNSHNNQLKYTLYIQKNDFKIDTKDTNDDVYNLVELMDLDKLTNGEIMCYGISKDTVFAELSYSDKKYLLRISNGKSESFEDITDTDVKNELYQKLKSVFGNDT